eukprot:scaffold16445_cov135-Isochrysis_galbana.AAC.2
MDWGHGTPHGTFSRASVHIKNESVSQSTGDHDIAFVTALELVSDELERPAASGHLHLHLSDCTITITIRLHASSAVSR